MNKSIWELNYKKLPFLNENKEVDVLIVGGGLTGIMTAYYLRNSNLKILVVERNKIGSGVTKNTTGKITYLQELIYQKLPKNKQKRYYDSQKTAINLIINSINKNNINCDLEKVKSYVFMKDEKSYKKFNKEIDFFKENNIPYKIEENLPINFPCNYAISVDDTYTFHPLKYLYKITDICLKNNIEIYENTPVLEIKNLNDYYIVKTNKNEIKAKKIILACHYPYFLYPYFFPLKTKLEKSYIVACKDKNKNFSAITDSYPTHSIRYYKDNLIYLSNSNILSKNIDDKLNNKKMQKKLKEYFNKTSEYEWTNYDIITKDSLPLIGYLKDNLLIGTGYNTWGMTNGVLAGKILSDLVLERKNKFKDLFDPKRKTDLTSFLNIVSFNLINATSFIKSYFYSSKCKKNKGKICPHLKCHLIYNSITKSYDCPCHGTIIKDDKVIKGPSKKYP